MRPPVDGAFAALLDAEHYEEALTAAEGALERLHEASDGDAEGDEARVRQQLDLHFVAIQAAFALGREEARRHAFAMLRCATLLADLPEQVRAHNALAAVYGAAGLYDEATRHLWTVVHLRERIGSEVEPHELNNLALVYLELERFDEAAALFRRAVEGFRRSDDTLNAALALVNVAATQRASGQPGLAVPVLHEALTTFEQFDQQAHVASTLGQLGEVEAALERPERARATFERALALVEAGHGGRHERALRVALGRVALEHGDAATALTQLERAAAGLGDEDAIDTTGVLPLLSRAYELVGRLHEALTALRRHVAQLERAERRAVTTAAQVRMLELEYGAGGDQEIARLRALELERVNAVLGRRTVELEHLSRTDPLTELPNRRGFEERLSEALAAARRHGRPLVLALLDFDHFKSINDRFGHDVGDAVLVRGAAVVRGALRASDVASRWGGEEFALLLPDTGRDEALGILERLRRAAATASWSDLVADVAVTVSIGAAALDEVEDAHALLRAADRRLFMAKRSGRDRVVVDDT